MIITKEWLNKHKTANGAWNAKQLKILGLNHPPRKGWMNRAVGQIILNSEAASFERFATSKGSKDKTKELQQQIIGLNKKIVKLQGIIDNYN